MSIHGVRGCGARLINIQKRKHSNITNSVRRRAFCEPRARTRKRLDLFYPKRTSDFRRGAPRRGLIDAAGRAGGRAARASNLSYNKPENVIVGSLRRARRVSTHRRRRLKAVKCAQIINNVLCRFLLAPQHPPERNFSFQIGRLNPPDVCARPAIGGR
ncbi:hypothetical protein EVAR_30067_1 [Eumeta japonica]|uniref:Uncharacterized protein n=1 Tax=Eumeta variegata TaxID=151549 RepID=A0A4C1X7N4_EUMVA|nr:hypothetical protein EVAR_30067_1 [Eumeta japonica]